MKKTATKFAKPSPRSGVCLPLGAHPGNTGGKPGRSGRKPNVFIEKCIAATEDDDLHTAAKAANPVSYLNLAANYAHGKPKERQEISGELTIKVVFDD